MYNSAQSITLTKRNFSIKYTWHCLILSSAPKIFLNFFNLKKLIKNNVVQYQNNCQILCSRFLITVKLFFGLILPGFYCLSGTGPGSQHLTMCPLTCHPTGGQGRGEHWESRDISPHWSPAKMNRQNQIVWVNKLEHHKECLFVFLHDRTVS